MATFRGIAAVGTAVLGVFEEAWARDPFIGNTLATSLIRAEDLRNRPFDFGVTVYVYRVEVNGTQRTTPPGIPDRKRPLPVQVRFVISAWGPSAQRELELLGWCMRVLDDRPILTAADLNTAVDDVFAPDETIELLSDPLSLEEHHRLWDALPWDYQLSAAYLARLVRLDSPLVVTESGPVLERDLAFSGNGGDR